MVSVGGKKLIRGSGKGNFQDLQSLDGNRYTKMNDNSRLQGKFLKKSKNFMKKMFGNNIIRHIFLIFWREQGQVRRERLAALPRILYAYG